MKLRKIKYGFALLATSILSSQAFAVPCGDYSDGMQINDCGIVGTVDAGTQNASVDNVTDWANYLLNLGINASVTADGNVPLDNVTEDYQTNSIKDYDPSGTLVLSGGTRVNGATPRIDVFEWVMGKYDGKNAGYVLFNVADYMEKTGSMNIPEFSYSIWGSNAEQYQLSNITGFGGTPISAPAVLMIMSLGLFGVGFGTWRKKKHQG